MRNTGAPIRSAYPKLWKPGERDAAEMLYYLFFFALRRHFSALNVFRYITVRTAVASLTALVLSLLLGPWMIERLRALQVKQYIREEGPKGHQAKAGTPTMGGVLIVAAIVIPTLLWADLRNTYVLIALAATMAFGIIGFIDDYSKVVRKHNRGLTAAGKFGLQVLTCAFVGAMLIGLEAKGKYSTQLSVPFMKKLHPDLVIDSLLNHRFTWALAFVPFVLFLVLVIAGLSNGVNLTDGLDGLAIGCVLISSVALTVITYLSSNARFAEYLEIQRIPDAAELTIFCGSLAGASLGFLWYNAHPAEMFMGDVGSLALGGAIGTIAVILKQEILMLSIGGIFILELLSVIIQVGSFKLTGKRVFRMAPLHHHFELMGWSESKIIVRFWILALVFALFSLTTLKLR
jgi:phospho-N-acetylmuramoyl-pentapeptide-transferase